MPLLEISFDSFDTVCYSVQHNLMELIKHTVAIGAQVNINIGTLDSLQAIIQQIQELIEQLQNSSGDTAGQLNSLVLTVNEIERRLSKIERDYDTFKYAVTNDLDNLKDRVDYLEERID